MSTSRRRTTRLLRLVVPLALAALGAVFGAAGPARAADGAAGFWEGSVQGEGVNIRMTATIQAAADSFAGTMDIPQQGATGLALRDIRIAAGRVHFQLPTGGAPGVFDGTLTGNVMSGEFTQGVFKGTFKLTRGVAPPAPTAAGATAPPPYKEEEVAFQNGGATLAGTLTVPPGPGPHPVLVMVTGSGPQNRDEEIFGFKPFRLIADHLSRNGIAVLRYDDRGIGKSTGDFAGSTTADFAGDAAAAVKFLKTRAGIDPAKIGVCGHSEGGLIAPMVANQGGVAFIVLLAGPGVTGDRILIEQGRLILKAGGASDEEQAAQSNIQRHIFSAVRGLIGWDSVRAEMMAMGRKQVAQLPEAQRQAMGDQEKYLAQAVDGQIKGSQSPWMKYFLDHDPAPELRKVRCPVLALFGEKDLQVPAALDSATVGEALAAGGNQDVTLRVLPRANHLFLGSDTGSPGEYASMKKEFVPGFLDLMSDWIRARCGL